MQWPIVLVGADRTRSAELVDILSAVDGRVRVYYQPDARHATAVVDLVLPLLIVVADGRDVQRTLEAVSLLHRHRPEVPVLAEVPADHPLVALQALGGGAMDCMRQPVAPWEWQRRCSSILRAQRQKRVIALALQRKRRAWLQRDEEEAEPANLLSILARTDMLHDVTTGEHDRRTGQVARLIAEELGLTAQRCRLIEVGAGLHDIGKIGIPHGVLRKPGRYTLEEHAVMRAHPQIGHEILNNGKTPVLRVGAEIALSHHERYDGSGYPQGLANEAIPLSGRITAVADVFDALAARGTYRRTLAVDETIAYLRRMERRYFDPDCVEALRARSKEAACIVGAAGAAEA